MALDATHPSSVVNGTAPYVARAAVDPRGSVSGSGQPWPAPGGGARSTPDPCSAEDRLAALGSELASARARAEAARRALDEHAAASRAAMRAEVEASREQLAALERRHQETVEQVRAAAVAECARLAAGDEDGDGEP